MMSPCHSHSDIDECSSANECHQNATCNNTKGSYNCTCKDGFEGNGKNCTGKTPLESITTNSLRKRDLRKGKSNNKFLHYSFFLLLCYWYFCQCSKVEQAEIVILVASQCFGHHRFFGIPISIE